MTADLNLAKMRRNAEVARDLTGLRIYSPDPEVVLAVLDRLAVAEGAVERVAGVLDKIDRRIDAAAFDPTAIVTTTDLAEANAHGFMDGLRTAHGAAQIALDGHA